MKKNVLIFYMLFFFNFNLNAEQPLNIEKNVSQNDIIINKDIFKTNNNIFSTFTEALNKNQFNKARNIALDNKNTIEGTLKFYAEKGLTPVQWMYSEYLLNIELKKESAEWVYIALFNTRFDLKLCSDRNLRNLEYRIINSWNKIVDNAKNNQKVKQEALNNATDFIIKKGKDFNYIKNKNTNWICMYNQEKKEIYTIPLKQWDDIYKNTIKDYTALYKYY